jgi:hypothetical protein
MTGRQDAILASTAVVDGRGDLRHGGEDQSLAGCRSCRQRLNPLAPLHQPHNLSSVRAAQKAFPDALQVGCFDTNFHRRLRRRPPPPLDRASALRGSEALGLTVPPALLA